MRLLKTHPILGLLNSYMVDSPQPANISYMWNFGSLLGACLGIQIVTGVTLAMHYTPSVDLAFISVEHIMRDVNYGWMIRYLHANVASFFFIFVYLHIGRGLYYGSYKYPRTLVWSIGVIILVLMIIIAFLGYVLPYGQMSLWGATVITNLVSAVPWIGQDIVEFLWGGFSVNNATLNRFYSLHFVLPFALAALVVSHLIALHEHGSGNPLGISGNTDRIPFHPYFTFKDLVTVFAFLLALSAIVFYAPNLLGHSDNYIPANPMQTPASIVPEWYLLPFYAILRSIPNKLLGVIAMLAALLILLAMPLLDTSRIRGSQFRPLNRVLFWVLVADFFMLMYLGACHVEDPFITVGQVCTALYFGWFLVLVPVIGIVENTLLDLATQHETKALLTEGKDLTVEQNNRSLQSSSYVLFVLISSTPWMTMVNFTLTSLVGFISCILYGVDLFSFIEFSDYLNNGLSMSRGDISLNKGRELPSVASTSNTPISELPNDSGDTMKWDTRVKFSDVTGIIRGRAFGALGVGRIGSVAAYAMGKIRRDINTNADGVEKNIIITVPKDTAPSPSFGPYERPNLSYRSLPPVENLEPVLSRDTGTISRSTQVELKEVKDLNDIIKASSPLESGDGMRLLDAMKRALGVNPQLNNNSTEVLLAQHNTMHDLLLSMTLLICVVMVLYTVSVLFSHYKHQIVRKGAQYFKNNGVFKVVSNFILYRNTYLLFLWPCLIMYGLSKVLKGLIFLVNHPLS